uniref:ATP synthase complex subunit 8 n=1 Tax=Trimma okinawae TaxID=498271 RepID=A0A5K7TNJ5_9GOBI|nr:ATPase subunit 8 [Trimma okinawae]
MPQLNPAPWFETFMISWLTLLMIVIPLIMTMTESAPPESQPTQSLPVKKNWSWPWVA